MVSLSSSVHTTGAPRELAEESTRNDSANNTSTQQTKAKQQTTITDFVDSSFASVDRKYPNMAQGSSLVKILAIEAAEERSKSKKEKKSNSPNSDSKDKDKDEEDEDEAYATFTYLAILTALYLPFLLFLWIRRNVFGTASLVRSLFFWTHAPIRRGIPTFATLDDQDICSNSCMEFWTETCTSRRKVLER